MTITWKRCITYKSARNYTGIIYLHEWHDRPFYWGKAEKSFFGGHMRPHNENRMSGRYNVGYRHWIEGCLQHGAKLYIGELDAEALAAISEVENFLIAIYPTTMNTRKLTARHFDLVHEGNVPATIRFGQPVALPIS